MTDSSIYTGPVRPLRYPDQLAIAASLIASNGLHIAPDALVARFEANRLLVRYDYEQRALRAATGYKALCPKVRDTLLSCVEDANVRTFLDNVAGGRVREKGWGFNCSDPAAFRSLNRTLFRELLEQGYGAHRVFALVREENGRARAHVARLGFEATVRTHSPYSEHTLIVYVWTNESMALAE